MTEDFTIEQIPKHLKIEEKSRKCDAIYLNSKANAINENGSIKILNSKHKKSLIVQNINSSFKKNSNPNKRNK